MAFRSATYEYLLGPNPSVVRAESWGWRASTESAFAASGRRQELNLEGITGIIETGDGDLWLNGRTGIGPYHSNSSFNAVALTPAYRVHGETLGASDGVVGSGWFWRPLPTAIEAGRWEALVSPHPAASYGIDRHSECPTACRTILIRALTGVWPHYRAGSRLTLPAVHDRSEL